jgi:Zn-dependent M28 family amino/carboxypeptidase
MSFANDLTKCDGSCKESIGYNVIGKKIGKTRPDEYYLVGAHYDSVNQDEEDNYAPGCTTAPGAADNASGVAGVMELARVFSKLETDATVIFVAFGGEETGLHGSIQYVSKLIEGGEKSKLKAFVVLDMISYAASKEKERLLIEASNQDSTQKARGEKLFEYAKTYTTLNPLPIYWKYANSDHEPFLDKGMAGGLLIQMQCEAKKTDPDRYPFMHSADDTVDRQNVEFATEMLKVAAATLAEAGVTFLPATAQ